MSETIQSLFAAYAAEQQVRAADYAEGRVGVHECVDPLLVVTMEGGNCADYVFADILANYPVEWPKLPATRALAEALALMTVEQRKAVVTLD